MLNDKQRSDIDDFYNSVNQKPSVATALLLASMLVGYLMNAFMMMAFSNFHSFSDFVRFVGLFFPPIGAIMGYLPL